MNPTTLHLHRSPPPTPSNPAAGSVLSGNRAETRHPRAVRPSPTLELTRSCAAAAASGERAETGTLIFLAGCSMAALAGVAMHLERCLAGWASFENFVRAVLA